MKKLLALAMISMTAAFVGCGDDSGDGAGGGTTEPNGEVNTQTAQASTTNAITSSNLALSGNGIGAANQLSGLASQSLSLVGPAAAGGQSADGQARFAVQTGVCDCTETSCTFQDCSDDSGNAFTINGTLSWANGNVVADLDYTGENIGGQSYTFTVDMDVTVTATSIDGTVATTGSVTASGSTIEWDSSLVMNAIEFNASSCPTSGTLDVDASVTYAGAQSYSGQESITFDGTGC